MREVEEALARQVLYGGDLVTNLLEVARPDEARLVAVVAESFGLVAAPAGALAEPDEKARTLVPRDLAVERSLLPLFADDSGVVVLVAEPLAAEVEQELSFALSLPVSQRIAPLVRIRQALAATYQAPLDRRFARLVARLEGQESPVGNSLPPLLQNVPEVALPQRPPSEIPKMPASEGPGQLQARMASRTQTATGLLALAAPLLPSERSPDTYMPVSSPLGAPRSVQNPVPPAPPTHVSPEPMLPAPAQGQDAPPESLPSGETRKPAQAEKRAARAPKRRRGPLVRDVAKDEMERAETRDDVLDLFFEYCRQFFDTTVLFIVQGEVAEGFDAFGSGLSREHVVRIGVPLDMPSLLREAKETRRILHRGANLAGLDGVWLADLGLRPTASVVVAPLTVRKRCIGLIVGDGGVGGIEAQTVNEVSWFAGLAGVALERIIVRKKGSSTSIAPQGAALAQLAPAPGASGAPKADDPVPATSRSGPPAAPAEAPAGDIALAARTAIRADEVRARLSSLPAPATQEDVQAFEVPPAQAPAQTQDVAPTEVAEAPVPEAPAQLAGPAALLHGADSEPNTAPVPLRLLLATSDPQTLAAAIAQGDVAEPSGAAPSGADRPRLQLVEEGTSAPPPVAVEPPPTRREGSAPPPAAEGSSPAISAQVPSDQLSFSARKPPSSHAMGPPLPSVIIDTGSEFDPVVDRYLGNGDDAAFGELLRAGPHAMLAIMRHFPGPITADTARFEDESLPRASECGPLLRLIAAQRRVALGFVLEHVQSPQVTERFLGTLLVAELPYIEAVDAVCARIYDDVPRVRRAAYAALRSLMVDHAVVIVERVAKVALDLSHEPARRLLALDAMGELREAICVPSVLSALTDPKPDIVNAARGALEVLTRHDFGADPRRWLQFWQENASLHRVQWLIDALLGEREELAQAAAIELVQLTKQNYGYSLALPYSERERAVARYREWWHSDGKRRFARR